MTNQKPESDLEGLALLARVVGRIEATMISVSADLTEVKQTLKGEYFISRREFEQFREQELGPLKLIVYGFVGLVTVVTVVAVVVTLLP